MTELINRIKNRAIAVGITTVLGIAGAVGIYSYYFPETIQTKITDAQMAKVDRRYMIATEYGPFENHDARYRGKFNSGTIQNQAIKLRGKEVKIKKYGWRIPLFSMYENIRSIEEISEPNKI